jgi:hypothetical protein
MTNTGTEEYVSTITYKQAQTLYEGEDFEIKKNFNPNCQDVSMIYNLFWCSLTIKSMRV